MTKKRIYDVAKEYDVSSQAMLAIVRDLGYDVKSHMSSADEQMLESIRKKFEEEKETFRQKIKKEKTGAEERKKQEQEAQLSRQERKRRGQNKKGSFVPKLQPAPTRPTIKKDRKKRPKRKRRETDRREVEASVRRTLAQLEVGSRQTRKRYRDRADKDTTIADEEENVLRVSEFVSVAELAGQMGVKPTDVISKSLSMGLMVTINQRLDMDTIVMLADEFDFEVEPLSEYGEDILEEEIEEEERLAPRPPVVTIMGHVDHGKTSLLDNIRKSNVIAGEVGGITQHIGAHEVELEDGNKVTFLDTPGHEAFTAMRARGAKITDIVVLVVAADDDVMPQTIEAIDHARAAEVPIVVAINKIDRPQADPEKIKRQLSEHGVLVEDWGGKISCIQISAKTGENVDKLLETLVLEAEVLELTADPDKKAKGTIIESKLDPGKGPVATVLVQSGILDVGDTFVTGIYSGSVRAMMDERGRRVEKAGPSVPVQIFRVDGMPQAGDSFAVLSSERETREISRKRQQLKREQDYRKIRKIGLGDIHGRIQEGQVKDLNLIVKGDVDGSVEALCESLVQLGGDKDGQEEVRVNIIHKGVGAITESDTLLASASEAIIIGFHVRPEPRARELAAQEKVDIRSYRVIYEALEDVKAALLGLLSPDLTEEIIGAAEVRQIFNVSKVGTIAGCFVSSGTIKRGSAVRLIRDGVTVYESKLSSLKRFKDDAREVASGYECGMAIEGYNDIKAGDVIEAYEVVEVARSL